jgi:hypothetical protein
VINFFDWPENREKAPEGYHGPVASDFSECFKIVAARVKPERDRLGQKSDSSSRGYARYWWQYGRRQDGLYSRIGHLDQVLVRARVSNTHAVVMLRPDLIFSDQVVVFTLNRWCHLTVLQSNIHESWARQYSSTLKQDLRYSHTDAYETFTFPAAFAYLDAIGQRYHAHRQSIMLARKEGLTKTYNRFHDREHCGGDFKDIDTLRELHVEMDRAVAAAYGWSDLDLGHGFHDTKQGQRFTISEAARREVLARLLKLNHERYGEEVRQGLHEKKKPTAAKKPRQAKVNTDEGSNLFE